MFNPCFSSEVTMYKLNKSTKLDEKTICVIGGGNVGTQIAGVCALHGHKVKLYTSTPELFDGTIQIIGDTAEQSGCASNIFVTNDMEQAVFGCEYVFVTYPALMFQSLAEKLYPIIDSKAIIGFFPGTGGVEFFFKPFIEKGVTLFGLQRVPSVARLIERGKSVRVSGLRDRLYVGSIPTQKSNEISSFLSLLFGIPCESLPNYLSVTLTPSNSILHTSRLYSLFNDYYPSKKYNQNFLFYENWSQEASELLLQCDEELQTICKKLKKMDLRGVKSLRIHYESETVDQLTSKIRSIRSLHGLKSPMLKDEFGWTPDFSSRYFSTDFPLGLGLIEEFAQLLVVNSPTIHTIMDWYRNITKDVKKVDLQSFDIHTINDVYTFYHQ